MCYSVSPIVNSIVRGGQKAERWLGPTVTSQCGQKPRLCCLPPSLQVIAIWRQHLQRLVQAVLEEEAVATQRQREATSPLLQSEEAIGSPSYPLGLSDSAAI